MALGFLNIKTSYCNVASNILSAFMVGIIAYSVYLPVNTRPPANFSKEVSAPIVIIFSFLVILIISSKKFNEYFDVQSIYNGFILLGLSGALFRLVSY